MRSYFYKEILALKLIGISIDGYNNVLYTIYAFLIVGGLISLYTVLDFLEVFKHDLETIAGIITYQSAGVSGVVKSLVLIKNRVKIGKALDKLQQKPFLPNPNRGGDNEEKILNECIWVTSLQTYIYWCLASLTILITIFISLFRRLRNDNYREFPYGPFTFLNTTQSPAYEMSWTYQCCSVFLIGYAFVTIDLLICSVLAHISYQFKLLQNFLKQIVKITNNHIVEDASADVPKQATDTSHISFTYLQKSLATAVEYHLAIFDVVAEMESTFSQVLLIAYLETLVQLCFELYMASLGNNVQLLRHLIESLCATMQVALCSYWGEQVMQESELVGNAIYVSNFIGTDLRFQKEVALIIRRSQRPAVITAGKFTNIGLTTFAWILRTSYSAFMVLRNINKSTA